MLAVGGSARSRVEESKGKGGRPYFHFCLWSGNDHIQLTCFKKKWFEQNKLIFTQSSFIQFEVMKVIRYICSPKTLILCVCTIIKLNLQANKHLFKRLFFFFFYYKQTDFRTLLLKLSVVKVKVTRLCPTLATPWTIQSMEFSRPEYCLSFLQGIFPIQELNPWQADSLPAEPQAKTKNIGVGSLSLLQWIFQPRSRTRVSCIAGRFFIN